MAYVKSIYRLCFFNFILFSCTAKNVAKLGICSNYSISCTERFLSKTNASDSDCRLEPVRGKECKSKEFGVSTSSRDLGLVELKVYPYDSGYLHPALNITFRNIKWTVMHFRFSGITYFCRDYHLSPQYQHYIKEMFYDCLSTPAEHPDRNFIFEYEAEDENNLTEIRKFVFKLPVFYNIAENAQLQHYTPFLYVDITDVPKLIVRWQHLPFPEVRYKIDIHRKDKDGGNDQIVHSFVKSTEEFSHTYNTFPSSGTFYVQLHVLHKNCTNGVCSFSVSPYIDIDGPEQTILLVGIVGSVVLIPLFLFILWMWRRQCVPPSAVTQLPVVLIIHTPSRPSHLRSVIALTEYLREHCFVEGLLDELDIPCTESKDPWAWYNKAFNRADYVMVVSSPQKCCNEEGIFKNLSLVALRFLKEMFSRNSSKCFFSVVLPYCTEEDIPEEVDKLRIFKLMRDFDKMLWYIHNGGRSPSFVESIKIFLDPKPHGGKSDLNVKGASLLAVFKEAEYDRVKVCDCLSKKTKESDDGAQDENLRFMKKLQPLLAENKMNFGQNDSGPSLQATCSTSRSVNEHPDEMTHGFPINQLNNLLGESDEPPVVIVNSKSVEQPAFNIHNLSL